MLWEISVWCQDTNLDAANEQNYYSYEQMEKHFPSRGSIQELGSQLGKSSWIICTPKKLLYKLLTVMVKTLKKKKNHQESSPANCLLKSITHEFKEPLGQTTTRNLSVYK